MKRITTLLTALFIAGILLTSCNTQKDACPAYSQEQVEQQTENNQT